MESIFWVKFQISLFIPDSWASNFGKLKISKTGGLLSVVLTVDVVIFSVIIRICIIGDFDFFLAIGVSN